MSGFLSVPFGVLITSVIVAFTHPAIHTQFTTVGAPDHVEMLTIGMIIKNLIPLIIICLLLALGLKLFPNEIVKGFKVFGKVVIGVLTAVVVACIVQHYTGLFTDILHMGWGFNPILADEEDTFRAIELLGTIAMMLTGAFPMVTLIRKCLSKPLEKLGRLAGLEASGSIGLVACLPNGLALFPFIKDMRPQDKVTCLAFLVCGDYCIGDFLAFNVNFQPNLLIPVFVGQVCGGIIGILFAKVLAVPQVNRESEREASKAS